MSSNLSLKNSSEVILQAHNIIKNYQQGADSKVEVLKGVSFAVHKNETVSIVGASGGGKSTLLSMLSGIDRPTSGSVQVLDKDLSKFSDDEVTRFRGQNIGIVFQQFHLVSHLTALENVMLPLEINKQSDPQSRAQTLLEEVGLKHRLDHRPAQLSGGEIQRVAIARAIASQPKLILADEPSGNLDVNTGSKIMDLLFEMTSKHNSTLVLVTHSPELAARCSRQLMLEDGKIREK